jgi:hypothetical protein
MKGLRFVVLFSCTVVCRLQCQLRPRCWSCPAAATTGDFEQCANGEHIDFTSGREQDSTAGSQATGIGVETRCRGAPWASPQGPQWRLGQGRERHRYSTAWQLNTRRLVFAIWTMHSHMINKEPTNASKYECIIILIHCYMFRRFKASSSGSSVSWIVAQSRRSITGWGLYIVTVCVVVGMFLCWRILIHIRILQLDTTQPWHRESQYTALILLCFYHFGQQFSRLTLNYLM